MPAEQGCLSKRIEMAKQGKKFKHIFGRQKKTVKASGPQGVSLQQTTLQQALALHQAGRLPEAETLYRQILFSEPNHPEALHYLGLLVHQMGRSELGVELISKAISSRPAYVEAHFNLGKVFKTQGKLEEAAVCYRRALTLKPDYAEAHFNLGIALFEQNRADEAIASYRQGLILKPDYAETHNNLGVALHDQGRLAEAAACYRRALALKPDFGQVHYNLGITLKDLGELDRAAESFRKVLEVMPGYGEAHYNLGVILNDQGKLDEAVASYRHALALKPSLAEAHNNLGVILNEQGQLDEAVACYRQALTLKPDYPEAHSNLLMCLNYLPGLSAVDYLNEARLFGRKAAIKVRSRFSGWICPARPGRLRIGMISGDFRNHPVGYFLENLLDNIDPSQIDLVAYPTQHDEDELTSRIRHRFAAWKPLWGMDDEAAARLISNDGVHILLDLAGHTRHNRLPAFAWKPAPVQAAWLGYFASTGMEEIDYLLADPVSVPESHQTQFTEKVWYLPETRFCFSPPVVSEDLLATPLPALHNGCITFGSFQSLAKINDEVLTVWGRIIQAMPHARLRLQNRQLHSPIMREQLLQRLARNGIAPDRVTLEQSVPRADYLAAYGCIDIILDTFPFTGGTTTCEALWMGVPTVTPAGMTMVARQGASMLACVGLADWIARGDEDYVVKALAHAADLEKLARLRAGLRQQLLESPLCDSPRFARNFEAAMWEMWRSFEEKVLNNFQDKN
jgi:predicted O-linked N-acetylglucosamine transferase (SPINDLY family)